ncbi:hypothetical protein GCM10010912_05140 [Paenibacillus albidus]|uniref:Uncharacterized protein n=1 Tax=Paenibacillus albidus TaxID=2041023 RepID=A0A917BY85_9BACL|nr:hypothetical protein GCM10010912_05140 [Paenibacillus albidus]
MLMHGSIPPLLTRLAVGFGLWKALRPGRDDRLPIHPFGTSAKFGSPVFPLENSAHIQLLTRTNISLLGLFSKAVKKMKKE